MEIDFNQNDIHESKDCSQLNELKGATVTNVGFTTHTSEGGLTIDFIKDGKNKRIILGTNDLGTWIHFYGDRKEWGDEDRKNFIEVIELRKFIRDLYQKPPYSVKLSQLSKEQKLTMSRMLNINKLNQSHILGFTYGH